MIIIVTGLFLSLQPAWGYSTSKVKWLGKGKFGVAVGGDLSVNGSAKNAKFAAAAKPYVKGKLFGKQFTLVDIDGKLGNYNSTDWNASQRDQKFDSVKINQVKYYMAVRPFGVAVSFAGKSLKPKKGSFQKNITLYSWRKYKRKEVFKTNIPAGPIVIRVSAGVFGAIEYKPTFSIYGLAAMSLTSAPKASMGAFAEGAVNLAIFKGGIGATLTLIEGWGGLRLGVEPFPGIAGLYLVAGVDVLKGKVYAFVDRISIKCCFKKRWKRMLNISIFGWSGMRLIEQANKSDEFSMLPNSKGGFDVNWEPKKAQKVDLYKLKPVWKKRYQKALWYKELYDYNTLVTYIQKSL